MSYRPPVQDNFKRSGAARRVESILDKMDISYESEQEFPPYAVDIYLPEWHVAIEVDGPFHTKSKDLVRDKYLEKFYKLPVRRLNSTRWQQKGKIKQLITQFIELHCEDVATRKEVWLNRSGN